MFYFYAMNTLLRNTLDDLKAKVENLVSRNRAFEKELKQIKSEKVKLEAALENSKNQLEHERNQEVSEGINASTKDTAKLANQIDKYIKLIDTSIAQIKS